MHQGQKRPRARMRYTPVYQRLTPLSWGRVSRRDMTICSEGDSVWVRSGGTRFIFLNQTTSAPGDADERVDHLSPTQPPHPEDLGTRIIPGWLRSARHGLASLRRGAGWVRPV